MRKWRRWLLEALAIVGIVLAVQVWQARGLPEGAAPELGGSGLDGAPLALATTIAAGGGKPVLVAFWATWCPVCKAEAGNLVSIAGDTPFLSIAMQSGTTSAVSAYLGERAQQFPTINDPEGTLAAAWRVRGVPSHFIVDGQGNIRFRVVGYATEWGLRARLWWAGKFPQ